jgi:uncharacterized membrane protein
VAPGGHHGTGSGHHGTGTGHHSGHLSGHEAKVVRLLKASGGKIEGGQRSIARALGISKSPANELLHELAQTGLLSLSTSRSGTTVALT